MLGTVIFKAYDLYSYAHDSPEGGGSPSDLLCSCRLPDIRGFSVMGSNTPVRLSSSIVLRFCKQTHMPSKHFMECIWMYIKMQVKGQASLFYSR